ncbi:nuclear transport factor 2 family protein [Rhodococcus sp. NPDC003382]|uniref:nuclear transport factor 2 family protein n=1 Tax=Rhodococcus sp. CX TaxID=2789880 RepID=UPI0018CD34C8|nr:nuclear transport factor 2 family protein [Rhodococcus sp. CX]MBH0120493.1 nuclear transport factor 2 family protein [Rhodococcus sp. CX]
MNAQIPCPSQVSTDDVVAVHQLYGRQSHAIDSGRAEDWAATFTVDGEFLSPSYPAPARGADELVAFAERFHADCRARGEVLRHVLGTVEVRPAGPGALHSRAYLQIVGTPAGDSVRLHRITVLEDEIEMTADGWKIRRRTVHPDR